MKASIRIILSLVCMTSTYLMLGACQGSGGGFVPGNENGSEPINNDEAVQYRKAVLRCYKTGGSRVVKVEGKLNCY